MKRRTRKSYWPLVPPAFLAACLLLGGASVDGVPGTLLLELGAIGILAAAVWRGQAPHFAEGWGRPVRWFLALLATVILLQFLPLPETLWLQLPGRGDVGRTLELAGVEVGWRMVALSPLSALEASMKVLVPLAIFVALATQNTGAALESCFWTLIGVTIVALFLGLGQRLEASELLIFYSITNREAAIGFFANANHFATLTLSAIVATSGLYALARTRAPAAPRKPLLWFYGALLTVFVAGVALIASLAGWALLLVALLFAAALFGGFRLPAKPNAAAGVGITLVFVASAALLYRYALQTDLAELHSTQRPEIFARTLQLAMSYMPVGSGFGSFQAIYPLAEQNDVVTRFYVNEAHNEYPQVLLELGVAGLLLMGGFIFGLGLRSVEIWRRDAPANPLAATGTGIALIYLLHSLLDYPLRTPAGASVFALALAAVFAQHRDGKAHGRRGSGVR